MLKDKIFENFKEKINNKNGEENMNFDFKEKLTIKIIGEYKNDENIQRT